MVLNRLKYHSVLKEPTKNSLHINEIFNPFSNCSMLTYFVLKTLPTLNENRDILSDS